MRASSYASTASKPLRYAGIGLGGDVYVGDLPSVADMWAQNTLWHAFWTPERVTVCEADCARRYLDRSGNKDVDPAWDWLPYGTWSDVDGSRPIWVPPYAVVS